ncbi:unnamed protein product [Sphagnum troendelagicum]
MSSTHAVTTIPFVDGIGVVKSLARQRTGAGSDVFVVACTDGAFYIISKGGREEKRFEAHEGAVICIRWNFEGTALATGGEDGILKIWSRNGMHRSTLAQIEHSVYTIAWGPNSEQIVFSNGRNLLIKSIQASEIHIISYSFSSTKQVQWLGHEGLVLKVDWNPVNNCIISAGEDCHYKVWDCYGRVLYQSAKADSSIMSIAWCPSGEAFAVGSFNSLMLCDKTGWPHSKETPDTGMLLSVAWNTDGTQLAGAGGNGMVIFGQLLDRRIHWTRFTATLAEHNHICIQDLLSKKTEEMDFRNRVIKMSMGYQHLVVATATQCYIYSITNWSTPHMFDIKDTVVLVKQCQCCFLLVDCFTGFQLFTYEGRHLSNPKFQGIHAGSVNHQNISLSSDIFAVINHEDRKMVHFMDVTTGKMVGDVMRLTVEAVEISLSPMGTLTDRKLAFIDSNHDLYLTPILRPRILKLAAMVYNAMWNEIADMLAAVVDQRLVVWYYPHAAYVDKDLLPFVKLTKDCDVGKSAKIQSFYGAQCSVDRTDGASISTNVSPYPLLLFEHMAAKHWDYAIRLCYYVKDNLLWACLAASAIAARELNCAEMAYAALDEVAKVQFILHVKRLPSEESQQAELALFQRQPEDAESILLQAGLTYRAIKLNLRLFNWDRALDLAIMYKTHLDTVLWKREQYLQKTKHDETKEQFLHYHLQVDVDVQTIKARIKEDKEKENHQTGAG